MEKGVNGEKRRKIIKGKFPSSQMRRGPFYFVLGVPKWKFSTGKKHFTPEKKSGK